jgi:zinc protease
MKKYTLLFLFLGYIVVAQSLDLKQSIPNDPSVKTGVLKNGMTYYIKHNKKQIKKKKKQKE